MEKREEEEEEEEGMGGLEEEEEEEEEEEVVEEGILRGVGWREVVEVEAAAAVRGVMVVVVCGCE